MIKFIGAVRTDNALASVAMVLFGMTGSVARKALGCLTDCLDFIFLVSRHRIVVCLVRRFCPISADRDRDKTPKAMDAPKIIGLSYLFVKMLLSVKLGQAGIKSARMKMRALLIGEDIYLLDD